MKTIAEVIAAKKELNKFKNTGDEYYKKTDEFTEGLRLYMNKFRNDTLNALTKDELVDLIQICSTYRPIALHSILLTLSRTSQFY